MTNNERLTGSSLVHTPEHHPLPLDVPSLETVLHSSAETRLDGHLGPGVIFPLGEHRSSTLELYHQVVRLTLPCGELAIPRREPQVAPEGVVFEDPEHFFLSVGPGGDVLFQYSPPSPTANGATARREQDIEWLRSSATTKPPLSDEPRAASPAPAPPSPNQEAKEHAKSEKYVGRLGEVKTHRTKQGKLVAEVELSVPDPDRPGSNKLVKFAAFGEKAEALQNNYQVGQLVTAVGIPHDLHRQSDGRKWIERQYYLVQLPRPR